MKLKSTAKRKAKTSHMPNPTKVGTRAHSHPFKVNGYMTGGTYGSAVLYVPDIGQSGLAGQEFVVAQTPELATWLAGLAGLGMVGFGGRKK